MATAPCQLQAEVNDFTKCYSHPDLQSLDGTMMPVAGTEDERSRSDSTKSDSTKPEGSGGVPTSNAGLFTIPSIELGGAKVVPAPDFNALMRKTPRRSYSANGYENCPGLQGGTNLYGCDDEGMRRRSVSILEVKEHANSRLREELLKAQKDLQLKDEQVKKLAHVQEQMSTELEELTAKLFEEANNMVQDAHVRRIQSEKLLKEANSKIEVLQAEVTALKTLVITSTPSMPNRHLHPQIEVAKKKESTGPVASVTSFIKGHRRSTSHHNFTKEMHKVEIPADPIIPKTEEKEVDPYFFDLFKTWRASSPRTLDQASPLLNFIINGDIMPCMEFANKELSQAVFRAVWNNTLTIEPDHEKNPFPRPCALTKMSRQCKYRIRLGDGENWHVISQLARNRITAVCDFYTYIRYITQGLVKSDDNDIYWEIIRLRKLINLTKLGLS